MRSNNATSAARASEVRRGWRASASAAAGALCRLWGWHFLIAVGAFLFAFSGNSTFADPNPLLNAFPSAAGYGRATQGGRGGAITYVTNLNDSGPGSFRACAEATGRRTCVFRVGGVINLQTPLAITATRGSLSILGQTAPGGGILLTINPSTLSAIKTPLYVKGATDVLIRHIRIRLQYITAPSQTGSGLTIENSQRVYVDHVSTSWAKDENLTSHKTTTNITVAYSVFGEGLQNHSKCALLGSDPIGPQNITFWRNICISNNDRNPDNNHYAGSCIEITNNIFYNARSEWSEVFSQQPGGTPISYVSNYYKAGPNTNNSTYAILWQNIESAANPRIFQSGNVVWASKGHITLVSPAAVPFLVTTPPCPLSAPRLTNAEAAYDEVRARAGAFPRDGVDQRFVSEIAARGVAGTGKIKSVPGPLPSVAAGVPYIDNDRDGAADSAEALFGGVVGRYDPWTDSDRDGWPNIDEFMEWLSLERIAGRYPH
jgi:pectate lyase